MTSFVRAAAVAAVAAAIASGCTSAPSHDTFIAVSPSEGARWFAAETTDRYGCDEGVLACSADGGRLSQRQCRCSGAP
jgi:hypothetical protein